jgi:RNA polymerase sigma-70 factor (ECF subfamily)
MRPAWRILAFGFASLIVGRTMTTGNESQREPTSNEPHSDRSLLQRLRDGEEDAATLLYLRYAGRLGALAQSQRGADLSARVDPEDLVQSIFRTFFRHAAEGDYDVPDGEDLWKLFLVISLHKISDVGAYHRAAKRSISATRSGPAFDEAAKEKPGQDEIALNELRLVIDEILGELPESQKLIVEHRIEGYRVEEIAEMTKRSKRSVERALQDFRLKLSNLISEDG